MCHYVMQIIKQTFKIEDSLIVFPIRGVGKMLKTVCADNFTYDHLDVLSGRGYEEGGYNELTNLCSAFSCHEHGLI